MYSWVTQEQWLILSIICIGYFIRKFDYNYGLSSKKNKILILFIPASVLMFIGSLMEILRGDEQYISIHTDIVVSYGLIIFITINYWNWKDKGFSTVTKITLVVAIICIIFLLAAKLFDI